MNTPEQLNSQKVVSLAIASSFLINDWIYDTHQREVEDQNGWASIIKTASEFCEWVGMSDVNITINDVCQAIWGDDYEPED